MISEKIILSHYQIQIIIKRLVYEIIENNLDNTAIIGMQPRGTKFAQKLLQVLQLEYNANILYGEIDTTFYRDDFRRGNQIHLASTNSINFSVEDKKIILIDDVLYTGRSVRAAMDALTDYGRPSKIELLTLIDRKYNRETPVQPDYVGKTIDTRGNKQKVKVEWIENDNKVWLLQTEM